MHVHLKNNPAKCSLIQFEAVEAYAVLKVVDRDQKKKEGGGGGEEEEEEDDVHYAATGDQFLI